MITQFIQHPSQFGGAGIATMTLQCLLRLQRGAECLHLMTKLGQHLDVLHRPTVRLGQSPNRGPQQRHLLRQPINIRHRRQIERQRRDDPGSLPPSARGRRGLPSPSS